MTFDFNKVIVNGNATADAKLRTGQNGTQVASVTIAVNKVKKDGTQDTPVFQTIKAFNENAQKLGQVKKGQEILVEGYLHPDSYTNNDGVKVYTLDVNATELGIPTICTTAPAQAPVMEAPNPNATAQGATFFDVNSMNGGMMMGGMMGMMQPAAPQQPAVQPMQAMVQPAPQQPVQQMVQPQMDQPMGQMGMFQQMAQPQMAPQQATPQPMQAMAQPAPQQVAPQQPVQQMVQPTAQPAQPMGQQAAPQQGATTANLFAALGNLGIDALKNV